MSLSGRVLEGDRCALARLLTYVENDDEVGRAALDRLFPHTGDAHLIGVTGPPGAGKSTLVNEMVRVYRARGGRVAVVAVDPSSPLTGGATLGDRIRMGEWHADPAVFIRSMASRRHTGGLAATTLAVAHVLDAAGFDPVIVETVGTGQDEVAIADLVLTTVLVQVPGLGDSVQTLKAGALEVGDIVVVNKADRPDSGELARDLQRLNTLRDGERPLWDPPVLKTSATEQRGIEELVDAIDRHQRWLASSGEDERRRRRIAAAEIAARVQAELRRRASAEGDHRLEALLDRVMTGELSPQRAAEQVLDPTDDLSKSGEMV